MGPAAKSHSVWRLPTRNLPDLGPSVSRIGSMSMPATRTVSPVWGAWMTYPVADVDGDVMDVAVVENEVARRELGAGHVRHRVELAGRVVRQRHPGRLPRGHGQAGAVVRVGARRRRTGTACRSGRRRRRPPPRRRPRTLAVGGRSRARPGRHRPGCAAAAGRPGPARPGGRGRRPTSCLLCCVRAQAAREPVRARRRSRLEAARPARRAGRVRPRLSASSAASRPRSVTPATQRPGRRRTGSPGPAVGPRGDLADPA